MSLAKKRFFLSEKLFPPALFQKKSPRTSKSPRVPFSHVPHLKAVFPFRKGAWGKTLYFFPKKERVFPQIVPKTISPSLH